MKDLKSELNNIMLGSIFFHFFFLQFYLFISGYTIQLKTTRYSSDATFMENWIKKFRINWNLNAVWFFDRNFINTFQVDGRDAIYQKYYVDCALLCNRIEFFFIRLLKFSNRYRIFHFFCVALLHQCQWDVKA